MIRGFSPKHLKPKFLFDPEGNLFVRITVGKDSLTRPVPGMATREEAEAYINKLVPDMAKELYQRRKNRLKRTRRSLHAKDEGSKSRQSVI
jgi:hypothetical protein